MFSNCKSLLSILNRYNSVSDYTPVLYHVTAKKNLSSILNGGLKTKYFGTVHGSMDIQPKGGVYLSKFFNSNNLNTNLIALDNEFICLEIDTKFIDIADIYPDDAFFSGIALEYLFEDVDDIMESLKLNSEQEALYIYNKTFELTNENCYNWKIFSMWYLENHGEISVHKDIPPEAILNYHSVFLTED